MATVTPTVTDLGDGYGHSKLITWALTSANETGVAVGPELAQHTDLCWHITGTNWGGATCAAQGSNTNTDGLFGAVTNVAGGAAITYTADAGPKQQIEKPAYIRPKLTTIGTSAVVTVTLFARRNTVSHRR